MRAPSAHLHWPPVLLVLAAACMAALPPLHEMDLAQHLATGEWIVRNRAVPFVEPFAWTREGQPYFAYSWLMQVTYFTLLDAMGPLGLHLLGGVLAGSAVAASYWAARQFEWRRDVCTAVAVLHLALYWGVANTLRPQQVLFTAIPLAWGIAARISHRRPSAGRLLALTAVGALAANSHLFFPLTAVPIGFFLLATRPARPWLLAAGALAAGWMISPYALSWPQVFALNSGHNELLARPPSVLEFWPGVEYARNRPGVIIAAVALFAAPWLAATPATTRQHAVRALYWTLGLLLFAYAGRLVLAWWTLAFPLVGVALTRVRVVRAAITNAKLRTAAATAAAALVFVAAAPPVSAVFWLFEGDATYRMLPRAGEDPALWLPSWLLCHTRPGASGRIYTEFNYGSELNWRLPGYSPSIDGRTIFPDSIARDFAFSIHGRRRVHATAWRGADLALVDRAFWLAPVLDAEPGWILLAQARRTSWGSNAALWATREWWDRWGIEEQLPAADIAPGDDRGVCSATGRFPAWGAAGRRE
jgi:hypothetical protein